ncbi:MAG TPA: YceH family protein [Candidatus Acidoferrum sp.]|nr:YceH family protein [Candidatus Acidoferrum sp.]
MPRLPAGHEWSRIWEVTGDSVSFQTVNIILTDVEARVLGCLVEKEITTPEYYPLSLNALLHACNQKSNRDPLMNLDESDVRGALRALGEQVLVRSAGGDSRVAKYEHRLADTFNFTRPETAILCELLLRGPQTPGELRSRAERMHLFEDLSVVLTTLKHLMEREPPLVALLPRQPGMKEARYAHLLSGPVDAHETQAVQPISETRLSNNSMDAAQMERLTTAFAELQKEIADLKRQFAEFRKQFE